MLNRKNLLRTVISFLCIVSLLSSHIQVYAKPSSKDLEKKTSALEGELGSLNSELSALSSELTTTASEIEKLAQHVEKTKLDLAAAKLNEEAQYEAMSERIKFMYEGGSLSLLHILFSSENMGDFLNKAEYVSIISDYDRDMLRDFTNIRTDVEKKQQDLEEQQNDLTELLDTLNAKQSALKDKISATSGKLSDYKDQLARAKAAEEALKQAQDNETSGSIGGEASQGNSSDKNNDKDDDKDNNKNESSSSKPASVSDVALMAGIIQCEAGSSYDGMLAVGTVIMNRIASSRFPNTLKGVVYQSGQFGPVSSVKLARVLAKGPNSSSYAAAQEVLGGKRVEEVKNCLYFNGDRWTNHPGVNIGGNIFW